MLPPDARIWRSTSIVVHELCASVVRRVDIAKIECAEILASQEAQGIQIVALKQTAIHVFKICVGGRSEGERRVRISQMQQTRQSAGFR